MATLGFDVYGTLIDPLKMHVYLQPMIGIQAVPFAALWREKQIEYAFRRGLMHQYQNFDICTQQALQFAISLFKVQLSEMDQESLLGSYNKLPAFSDVFDGLIALKKQGHRMIAFSNGVAASIDALLGHAGILKLFDEIVSVDDLQTFKPDPRVYHYLTARGGLISKSTWLVSSNSWDVIGAKMAGIRAAWVQRNPDQPFDSWGISPDCIVSDLEHLAEKLATCRS